MISYFLARLILGFVALLISPLTLLPDAVLPDVVAAVLATIAGYLWVVWTVMPVTLVALISATIVTIGIESHLFSYKVVRWIYSKIPGVN
jgi:hypothetical protein